MAQIALRVITRFQNRLTTGTRNFEEMVLAAYGKRRQASLESMLASQFALTVTVQWEVFINDLLVAYVATDPETFMNSLGHRLEQAIKDRFGMEAWRAVTVELPSELTLAKVPAWLDRKDFNVTVKSAEALAQRANAILAARYARKFTLDPDNAAIVDFGIALRNYLAHSPASRRILNAQRQLLTGANAELAAAAGEVGAYLKSRTANGTMRVCVFASRLSAVAGVLSP
jgi:hypothetical protein